MPARPADTPDSPDRADRQHHASPQPRQAAQADRAAQAAALFLRTRPLPARRAAAAEAGAPPETPTEAPADEPAGTSADASPCAESELQCLIRQLQEAEAVLIGAGAGLSTSAGYCYDGPVFEQNFADFIARYHFTDMYTAGFFRFPSLEEHWAYWSRHIYLNRYCPIPRATYASLLKLVEGRDYFVLTTNVDHCFQRAGFAKERLFYTQGDYGLWQCSVPCQNRTWDNETQVRAMLAQQKDRRIPASLVPYCPRCGAPMTMNLRADATFVEDEGWYRAQARYRDFVHRTAGKRLILLELGVGGNTPGIIKYPFWQMAFRNARSFLVCLNLHEAFCPPELAGRSLCLAADIDAVLRALIQRLFRQPAGSGNR